MKPLKFLGTELQRETGIYCIMDIVTVPGSNRYKGLMTYEDPESDTQWSTFRFELVDAPGKTLFDRIFDECVTKLERVIWGVDDEE